MIIRGLVLLITMRAGKGLYFIAFHLTLNGIVCWSMQSERTNAFGLIVAYLLVKADHITRSLKQCFKIGNMQPEKDPYWS